MTTELFKRKSEKFSFDNSRGDTLAGVIDLPDGTPPLFYGVFAPCFTCVKESHGAAKICRALAERGGAMLRFDMTGLGQSTGHFSETNMTTRIADIVAACNAFGQAYAPPTLLIGHSISGTAALSAAHHIPSVKNVVTIGSPADSQSVIAKFRRLGHLTEKADGIELLVIDRMVAFNHAFEADLLAGTAAEDTRRLSQNLWVFHAPNDTIVSFDNAQTIVDRAPHARLIALADTATHLFERGSEDALFVADFLTKNLSLS